MPAGITNYGAPYIQFSSTEQATVTASTKFWKDLQDLFPEECDQIYLDIIKSDIDNLLKNTLDSKNFYLTQDIDLDVYSLSTNKLKDFAFDKTTIEKFQQLFLQTLRDRGWNGTLTDRLQNGELLALSLDSTPTYHFQDTQGTEHMDWSSVFCDQFGTPSQTSTPQGTTSYPNPYSSGAFEARSLFAREEIVDMSSGGSSEPGQCYNSFSQTQRSPSFVPSVISSPLRQGTYPQQAMCNVSSEDAARHLDTKFGTHSYGPTSQIETTSVGRQTSYFNDGRGVCYPVIPEIPHSPDALSEILSALRIPSTQHHGSNSSQIQEPSNSVSSVISNSLSQDAYRKASRKHSAHYRYNTSRPAPYSFTRKARLTDLTPNVQNLIERLCHISHESSSLDPLLIEELKQLDREQLFLVFSAWSDKMFPKWWKQHVQLVRQQSNNAPTLDEKMKVYPRTFRIALDYFRPELKEARQYIAAKSHEYTVRQ
ncbi:hypothetical protein [Candidatus Fukatsuia endosymbiont of Tuberolachnus salignus]|uniref:hypothetical protein n=1 Tax=Candidatus Fukatsuia endosymbiont of Tuberolachnus salignus TaxID=3077957 RepID=UPI00313D5390